MKYHHNLTSLLFPKSSSLPSNFLLLFSTMYFPHCWQGLLPTDFMPFTCLKSSFVSLCIWKKFKSLTCHSRSLQLSHQLPPWSFLHLPPDTLGFCCTEFFLLPGMCHAFLSSQPWHRLFSGLLYSHSLLGKFLFTLQGTEFSCDAWSLTPLRESFTLIFWARIALSSYFCYNS